MPFKLDFVLKPIFRIYGILLLFGGILSAQVSLESSEMGSAGGLIESADYQHVWIMLFLRCPID